VVAPSRRQFLNLVGLASASAVAGWLPFRNQVLAAPPSGRVERITDVPVDRYVTIVEGKGRIG